MKVNVIGAALALLVGALPANAKSFKAINRLTVNPISATEFEVINRASSSPRALWCAAADYSGRRLDRYNKTDLIIITPIGPSMTQPDRNGVIFTIDPNQSDVAPIKSYSVTVKTAGASMSVGHAKMFCDDDTFPVNRR
jgi:hypothetical protein